MTLMKKFISPFRLRYFHFLLSMTEKEITARYKFAILGIFWVVLKPFTQMVIMGMIFQFFIPVRVDNYFLFLFVGLLPWNFFSSTVARNASIIVDERQLIQKSSFPRETIVFSVVLSNLFHFLVAFALLLIALLVNKVLEGYSFVRLVEYFARILLTLPLCVWLTFIASGFSLLFSALNVRFRDVGFIVQVVMPLWFYGTPVLYTLNLLPSRFQFIFLFNPLTSIIQLFQHVLLRQPTMPFAFMVINMVLGVMISFLGWKIFAKESPKFNDWV